MNIPKEINSPLIVPQMTFSILDKQNPKALIVDDNDFNRVLLGNILKSHGIPYVEAINGKVAVKLIRKFDRIKIPILCIIMDCDMPVMDGWQATKKIHKNYSEGIIKFLPAIIGHTAYSSTSDIKKCYDSGMISVIAKPTTQAQILNALRKYI